MRAEPTLDAHGRWSPFGVSAVLTREASRLVTADRIHDMERAVEENERFDVVEKVEGGPH